MAVRSTGGTVSSISNVPGQLVPRVYYASRIPGIVLDCDLANRAKIGGGTPTDNAAALNAVLATAAATTPVKLIIDGGCAIGAALLIPQSGHVTIEGIGWDSGLYVLPGSNSNAIQNFAATNLANAHVTQNVGSWSNLGSNVAVRRLKIDCNRGTYPNGNSSGRTDGTIAGVSDTPDARGPYPTTEYWLSGIILAGLDNVAVEDVWVYDSPTYHVNFFHCSKVVVDKCRIEAADPSFSGNTDGVHCNGGCSGVRVTNCWFATGDDCVAFNLDEGDGTDGGDLLMADCVAVGCQTVGRVYGQSKANVRRVSFTNIKASGVRYWGFNVGIEGGSSTLAEANHSIVIDGCDMQVIGGGGGGSMVFLNSNAGLVEISRCKMVGPTTAIPMVLIGPGGPNIAALRIVDCAIHRNADGNAAAYLLSGAAAGSIGDLVIDGFSLTEHPAGDYADIPVLASLTTTTVKRASFGGNLKGVGTVLDISSSSAVPVDVTDLSHTSNAGSPSATTFVGASVGMKVSLGRFTGSNLLALASGSVTLTGPGLVSSGLSIADSLAANDSLYLSSTQSGLAFKNGSGTVTKLSS
jgi:hypothetical protein